MECVCFCVCGQGGDSWEEGEKKEPIAGDQVLNVRCTSGGLKPCQELWLIQEKKSSPLLLRCP